MNQSILIVRQQNNQRGAFVLDQPMNSPRDRQVNTRSPALMAQPR